MVLRTWCDTISHNDKMKKTGIMSRNDRDREPKWKKDEKRRFRREKPKILMWFGFASADDDSKVD